MSDYRSVHAQLKAAHPGAVVLLHRGGIWITFGDDVSAIDTALTGTPHCDAGGEAEAQQEAVFPHGSVATLSGALVPAGKPVLLIDPIAAACSFPAVDAGEESPPRSLVIERLQISRERAYLSS